MPKKINQKDKSVSNSQFVISQIEQSVGMYRALATLLVNILTILIIANITLVGYALSSKASGFLFIGSLFPIVMLYLIHKFNILMFPFLYTTIQFEQQFNINSLDWALSTFLSLTVSVETLDQIKKVSLIHLQSERIKELKKLNIPVFGRSKRFTRKALIACAVGQLILPFILNRLFKWSFF